MTVCLISSSMQSVKILCPDYNFFLGLGWAVRPNEKIWDYYDSLLRRGKF